MRDTSFTYRPLDAKGWRMAMGLRPLDPATWLEVDDRRDEELALKRELLATRYEVVVRSQPAGDAPSAELFEEITRFLAREHPTLTLEPSGGEHPVVAAARLVQEDLCVMVRRDQWRLAAACVCFPSRWELAEKIGRTLDEIHGPVPLYASRLASPTLAFFDRLGPERAFWRLNWTLLDDAALHQPSSPRRAPEGGLERWHFRVERQTLRRLERTGAVVFTIRTYVASAEELCARYDDFASELLHSLETAPDEVLDYKGWRGLAPRLRAQLEDQ